MSDLSASDIIARRLYRAGARHAFGIPGGEVLSLMDALDRAGVRIVLSKHENCAGFMAEGTWHAGDGLAVLFATIGPGVANAANTIANAWQDRVPLIVLTGSVSGPDQHTYTHQVFDHVAMLKPVTKAAFRVEAGTASILIDKAIRIATTGRPGPVVLDVPMDVQREVQDAWPLASHAPDHVVVPGGEALKTARRWMAEAERPLVLAGLDAVNEGAAEAIQTFCRAHNAPLITTYKGKGLMAEGDPLCLGGAGLSPKADKVLLPLLAQSDCVVLAGYDPIEMRTGWRDPFADGQRVIDIGAETNTHYMHQATLNFVAPVAPSLEAIAAPDDRPRWADGAPAKARAALAAQSDAGEGWGPAAAIDAARKACPANTIATVDSGAHRIVLSQNWTCNEPRSLLQSTALCTMGCAVPLAIGRKLAEPDRPVIAFVGDAGLEMFLGELATIRDLKLGIPVVVFVDRSLALIELKQRGNQMANVGVDFDGTDFEAVARAMGGHGVTVHDRQALEAAITDAFEADTFTLVCAEIGRKAYDGRI